MTAEPRALTMAQWKRIPRDYKLIRNGQRFAMLGDGLEPVVIVKEA